MGRDNIIIIEPKRLPKTQLPCYLDSQYFVDKVKNKNLNFIMTDIKHDLTQNAIILPCYFIMTDIKHDLELNETGKDKILVPDVFRRGGLYGKK